MSLLDIIKDLFCSKSSAQPVSEPSSEVTPKAAAEPVVEVKSEPTPAPVTPPAPKKEAASDPQIPEDSTLRRHFLANLEAEKQPKYVEAAAPVVKKEEPVAVAVEKVVETNIKPTEKADLKLQIPEDSTLKRHFIATLKAEIESNMEARPTDPTLRRHHDATVQAEIDKLLA